ncbi:SDR family NAD(P)-dependent oxidoreductase [Mangrovicoccus algicola]|uniref:SDR family oxidoreductase n=1 Tax=Mangrovicoccus algicola TaxID=2771008 RepID=A0A8J6Z7Y7_9RHOB|nr:SDR family NAD(P)-dependent oxidoreductase [Mangrovicoccus algicola]MBE3638105.1 SDR family oxidoreductase [Mangrovicoccus algicola]
MTDTVFITGAASGIGLASARAFAAAGYNLVLSDLDPDRCTDATKDIDAPKSVHRVDVRDKASIEAAFAAGAASFGPITHCHANAGVSNMKPALELSEDDWDFNFSVNAKGVFFTNQVAVAHFLAHGCKGAIVNTASLAAKVGAPLLAHYSASKFAVLGWTQALAREHARDGIRVNAVCPGFVRTAMQDREIAWEAELRDMTPEQVLQDYIDQTPLGRIETAEDVADVVVFLASDGARFMTGQGVNVTGGVYMT